MCTVLLPPGVKPTAVKFISSSSTSVLGCDLMDQPLKMETIRLFWKSGNTQIRERGVLSQKTWIFSFNLEFDGTVIRNLEGSAVRFV
jgi:hypothetical protein